MHWQCINQKLSSAASDKSPKKDGLNYGFIKSRVGNASLSGGYMI